MQSALRNIALVKVRAVRDRLRKSLKANSNSYTTFRNITWNVQRGKRDTKQNISCSIMFSTTFHVISRKLDCFSNSVRSSVFLINKNKLGYTCYCRLNGMIQGSVSKKCAFLFEWELQLNNLVTPDKWPCLNCAEIFEFFSIRQADLGLTNKSTDNSDLI